MQIYLITWESPSSEIQFKAGKAFVEWYDNGGEGKDPEGFERLGWCSLVQNGGEVSIIKASSLKEIWKVYGQWRKMGLIINIQPAASMSEAASYFREMNI